MILYNNHILLIRGRSRGIYEPRPIPLESYILLKGVPSVLTCTRRVSSLLCNIILAGVPSTKFFSLPGSKVNDKVKEE